MQRHVDQKSVEVSGKCIGCRDCKGLCQALVDLALLPDVILTVGHAAR
jgi:hypothetical protein